MSRLRFNKVNDPPSPAANKVELFYDTAGPGYLTPVSLNAIDENGVVASLAHFAILDYSILKVTVVTATGAGTWTPTAGCRAAYVELIGGGGQGGGAATSSANCSVGSGGGGGAYAASWITGVSATVAYSVGIGGTGAGGGATGTTGADTTWASTVIVAKGGIGGAVMAAGTTHIVVIGGAGGAAASCTGDLKVSGGMGDKGIRLSATQGWSGNGGSSAFIGSVGANGVVVVAGGTVGTAAAAGTYGCGGGGAATTTTTQAGGAGVGGMLRIWEFA